MITNVCRTKRNLSLKNQIALFVNALAYVLFEFNTMLNRELLQDITHFYGEPFQQISWVYNKLPSVICSIKQCTLLPSYELTMRQYCNLRQKHSVGALGSAETDSDLSMLKFGK